MSLLSLNLKHNFVSPRIQNKSLIWPKISGIWFYSFCLVFYLTSSSTCLPLAYLLQHTGFPDVLTKCQIHNYLNTALAICSLWDIFPSSIYPALIFFKLASSLRSNMLILLSLTHQLWTYDTLPSKSSPIFKYTGYAYAHTYSLYIL